MPELITKHPDVLMTVLRGGGARCGPGQEQKILTKCRAERFCTTSSGEVCVFGLDEIRQMTQISEGELQKIVCRTAAASSSSGCATRAGASASDGFDGVLVLALGVVGLRALVGRKRRRAPARLLDGPTLGRPGRALS